MGVHRCDVLYCANDAEACYLSMEKYSKNGGFKNEARPISLTCNFPEKVNIIWQASDGAMHGEDGSSNGSKTNCGFLIIQLSRVPHSR